jgi:hypothetical protein
MVQPIQTRDAPRAIAAPHAAVSPTRSANRPPMRTVALPRENTLV